MNKWVAVIMIYTLSGGMCPIKAESSQQLLACYKKQNSLSEDQCLVLKYTEERHELVHGFEPWQQSTYKGVGRIWISGEQFGKADSITSSSNRRYPSKLLINHIDALLLDYGDDDLYKMSKNKYYELLFETARYSPVFLMKYCLSCEEVPLETADDSVNTCVYRLAGNIISFRIRNADGLLSQVSITSSHEQLGDVTSTCTYLGYREKNGAYLHSTVDIQRLNGRVKDVVEIVDYSVVQAFPVILERPENYTMLETSGKAEEVTTVKYGDRIYLVQFKEADMQSLVVEFNDYVVVAEAPLNSENGERLLAEVWKIAPDKPVKYFLFDHFHPHYLGGLRPFVHEGATILTHYSDVAYVSFLANASHSLKPDRLENERRPLIMEEVNKFKCIGNEDFSMEVHWIGEKSAHTKDYLIYYFPQHKMLFEGDLIYIKKNKPLKEAGDRQRGLYQAILDLDLGVEEVVQSWPLRAYDFQTIIPFETLKASVELQKKD